MKNEIFIYLGKGVFYSFCFLFVLSVVFSNIITTKDVPIEESCPALTIAINNQTLRDRDNRVITWGSIEGKQIARQCRAYIK